MMVKITKTTIKMKSKNREKCKPKYKKGLLKCFRMLIQNHTSQRMYHLYYKLSLTTRIQLHQKSQIIDTNKKEMGDQSS